jgi:hypothetical protein
MSLTRPRPTRTRPFQFTPFIRGKYLVVLEQMQGGLDHDLRKHEQIAPPIQNRAWNISEDDLIVLC